MIEIFQECYRDTRVKGEYGGGDGRRMSENGQAMSMCVRNEIVRALFMFV